MSDDNHNHESCNGQKDSDKKEGLTGDDNVGIEKTVDDLTYHEAHLFVMGAYRGLVDRKPTFRKVPDYENIKEGGNRWYWKGAYVITYLIKLVLILILAKVYGPEIISILLV